MKNIEDKLRQTPPAPVPDRLARAVAEEIRAARGQSPRWAAYPVPLWLCGTACCLFLAAGMILAPESSPDLSPPARVKVWVQAGNPSFEHIFHKEKEPGGFFLRKMTPETATQGDDDA